MSLLVQFLGALPWPVLIAMVVCLFLLLLSFLLLIAFVPNAAERFARIIDAFWSPRYPERKHSRKRR